jgi:hypothetical protein
VAMTFVCTFGKGLLVCVSLSPGFTSGIIRDTTNNLSSHGAESMWRRSAVVLPYPTLLELRDIPANLSTLGHQRIAFPMMGLIHVDRVWNVLSIPQRKRSVFWVCEVKLLLLARRLSGFEKDI